MRVYLWVIARSVIRLVVSRMPYGAFGLKCYRHGPARHGRRHGPTGRFVGYAATSHPDGPDLRPDAGPADDYLADPAWSRIRLRQGCDCRLSTPDKSPGDLFSSFYEKASQGHPHGGIPLFPERS